MVHLNCHEMEYIVENYHIVSVFLPHWAAGIQDQSVLLEKEVKTKHSSS